MKSFSDFKQQINEVLKASDPIEKWISDFVHSTNPKFAGKSKAERIDMAKGAYYGAQKNESVEESAAVNISSTPEQSMNEEHLVHVSDGSKYDEVPHEKDIEHVKTGAMHHGGEWAGHSDKGAFFKFKSKEDAEHFKRHVDKCPHRSCYADHVNEAVEYKGIGTDVVDKKKVLNPQPNLLSTKKTVKDFKEAKVYDPITKKMVNSKPIKVQAGGGATRNGVPVEIGPSKYKQGLKEEQLDELSVKTLKSYVKKADRQHEKNYDKGYDLSMKYADVDDSHPMAKQIDKHIKLADKRGLGANLARRKINAKEEVELDESTGSRLWHAANEYEMGSPEYHKRMIQYHDHMADVHYGTAQGNEHEENIRHHQKELAKLKEEVEHIDELKDTTLQSYRKKVAKDVGRAYAIHQDPYKKTDKDDMRKLSNRVKGDERAEIRLKKEDVQIDEVSKAALMRYIPAASRAAAQHVYTGKEAQTWAGHAMRANDYEASDRQLAIHKKEMGKSIKRLKGIDTATKKLGTKKTYEEFVQGLEESTGLPHKLVQAGKEKWHIYDTKTGELHSTYNNKNVAMRKYGELNDKHAGYDSPGGLVKSKYGVRKEDTSDAAWKEHEAWANSAVKTAAKEATKRAQDATARARKEDENDDSDHQYDAHKEAARLHKAAMKHYAKGSDDYKHHEKMADQHKQILGEEVEQIDELSLKTMKSAGDKLAAKALEFHGDDNKHYARVYAGKALKVRRGIERRQRLAKEETIDEATVATRSYEWGKMKVVHQGKSFNIPLHPEHHEAIAKLNDGESTHVKTEDGKTWKASREGDDVHFSNLRGQKASVKHSQMTESRGHKVLATFFKNREVAQRAFTGQNKPPVYSEKGIETPKAEKQEKLKEDQYTAEYKIKKFMGPDGQWHERKIRPHRVNFKNSKMRGEPAQDDDEGDVGMKEAVHFRKSHHSINSKLPTQLKPAVATTYYHVIDNNGGLIGKYTSRPQADSTKNKHPGSRVEVVIKEGFDNYDDIAKELIKRHGKNIDTGHINDLAGERDTHRGLDHAEVMAHVKKHLKEVDMPNDEKWVDFKPSKHSIAKALKKIKGEK